jgi:hypothetical protein
MIIDGIGEISIAEIELVAIALYESQAQASIEYNRSRHICSWRDASVYNKKQYRLAAIDSIRAAMFDIKDEEISL